MDHLLNDSYNMNAV